MASSFSTNSKLELITTGEKAGLWGTITNTNLQINDSKDIPIGDSFTTCKDFNKINLVDIDNDESFFYETKLLQGHLIILVCQID